MEPAQGEILQMNDEKDVAREWERNLK